MQIRLTQPWIFNPVKAGIVVTADQTTTADIP
jgi:hypothetical protein